VFLSLVAMSISFARTAANCYRSLGGLLLVSAITGCVTTPIANSPQRPAASLQPQNRAEAQKELSAIGWKLLSVSGPTNDRTLEFLQPTSYTKADDLTLITTYSVYGNEATTKFRSRSSMFGWEMNCKSKTARIVHHKMFSDVMGRSKTSDAPVKDSKFIPIADGSIPAYLYAQVCESGPSFGSGVLVSSNRVLTASHVVDRCTAIEAVIGETIMAAGYPLSGILSSDLTVTTGNVNSLAGIADNQSHLQISAQVSPSNSGGGLIDKSGNLVGLVVSKLDVLRLAAITGDLAQNVNFAVKPEVIKTFLDANDVRVSAMDVGTRLEPEVLAQRAREFTVKLECKSKPPLILTAL
jgi:S1-C subfamily serine protease